MYANRLIPTDGSEFAGNAVQRGIALAKRIGAEATVITVLPPFHTLTTDMQMIEDTPIARSRCWSIVEPSLAAVGFRSPNAALPMHGTKTKDGKGRVNQREPNIHIT